MANLKNTNINNNLELPQGTTGQRPSSPQEGQIRYNTDLETAEFWNGANWRPLSDTHPEATGGTVVDTDIDGVPYRIHYFTETGTDTLTVTNPGEVEYLIVAGGGGTGSGGGGAGGLVTGTISSTPQAYTITVGAGGSTGSGSDAGTNGSNSTAFGITAIGGGAGGGFGNGGGGPGDGGSGGGRGADRTTPGGLGTPGQGNNGGTSSRTSFGAGGGGGGAGSAGLDATNETSTIGRGGNGGIGIVSTITGISSFYSGGGAGGANTNSSPATGGSIGGLGGGGNGSLANNGVGFAGTPNTGGGAGGGDPEGSGNNGGSGIVIVRYPRNSSLDTEPDRTVVATQPNRFQIVREGLTNYIDPENPVSYPGNGTTVFSLVGDTNGTFSNNDISWTANAPSQISAFQTFETSDAGITYGKPSPARFNFGTNAPFAIAVWANILGWEDSYSNAIFCKNDGITLGGPYSMLHTIGSANGGIDVRGGLTSYSGDGSGWSRLNTDDGIGINEWHFCTWSYDGTTMRHFVDGNEVGSFAYSWPDNPDHEVHIMSNWSTGHFFNGYIGQHFVYNKSLTTVEIQTIFNSTRMRYGI